MLEEHPGGQALETLRIIAAAAGPELRPLRVLKPCPHLSFKIKRILNGKSMKVLHFLKSFNFPMITFDTFFEISTSPPRQFYFY